MIKILKYVGLSIIGILLSPLIAIFLSVTLIIEEIGDQKLRRKYGKTEEN